MDNILGQIFTEAFGLQVLGALILIVGDLLLGVWVALKTGVFEWAKVGDFYKTTVLPLLGGWLTVYFMYSLVVIFAIPDMPSVVTAVFLGSAYSALFVTLGSGIVEKARILWGSVPTNKPL